MKRILIAVVAVLACTACTVEMSEVDALENGALQTIQVSVASFGDHTKTAVDTSGHFTWSMGDQIGIYPVATTLGAGQTSQQIVFKINGTGDAKEATFTGTGWGLVTSGGYEYFSYYPYDSTAEYDEVAVSFADNLNQTANASSAHVAVNDYLYAPAIQPTDAASCVFGFKHLGVLAEFEITMPNDTWTKKFVKMEVSSDSIFTVSGKYNPSSATSSVAPTISENEYTNKLKLYFNNGAGFTPNTEGKIYAYFLIAPAATSGKTLNIKLWDEDNIVYVASITASSDWVSQDYVRGKCIADVKPTTVATDLSVNGTANCYIVPEYGKYKFLANKRGNGVDPISGDSEGPSITIGVDYYAEVIWETVNTNAAPVKNTIVVSDSDSKVGIEDQYIVFTATGNEGNALIALKNGDDIVWSWHIWSTSASLVDSAQTYPGGSVMMDRNLGALSASPGNGLTLGFHYQWGRPFPITGGCSKDGEINSTRMATTNSSVWREEANDATKGTLAYSAAHPTHFIYVSNSNYFKGTTKVSSNWLWTADEMTGYEKGKMPAFWRDTVKTMYDPCPVGWRVPKGGHTGVWGTAGFSSTTFIWNKSEKGKTFTSSAAFYPAGGYRGGSFTPSSGVLGSVGDTCFYWSSSVSDDGGYVLYASESNLYLENSFGRGYGLSVRPVHE